MKKNQAKILARAIYDLTDKTDKSEAIVSNFIAYLNQRRLNHLLPDILAELEIIDNQKNDIVAVDLESVNEVSPATERAIIERLGKRLGRKIKVKKSLNQDLLGGLLISYQDKIIDLSLRKQISNLKKQLIS